MLSFSKKKGGHIYFDKINMIYHGVLQSNESIKEKKIVPVSGDSLPNFITKIAK